MTSHGTGKRQRHTFPKSEILRGYRAFGRVFSRGNSIQSDCIRCYYDLQRKIPPYQCTVGFAVKKPGTAVRRNRIRRLLREAYRQQKLPLLNSCEEKRVRLKCVFLLDAGKTEQVPSYHTVQMAVGIILEALQGRIRET